MLAELGVLIIDTNNVSNFYANKNDTLSDIFVKDSEGAEPVVATPKQLNEYAIWLNSPWSYEDEEYEIIRNPDASPKNSEWKCLYSITGYDGVVASILGYGATPESALQDCRARFMVMQTTYNPKGEAL